MQTATQPRCTEKLKNALTHAISGVQESGTHRHSLLRATDDLNAGKQLVVDRQYVHRNTDSETLQSNRGALHNAVENIE